MYQEEEQYSLFGPDSQSTKMCQGLYQATEAQTGRRFSQASSKSQTRAPRQYPFLMLVNGSNGGATWERDFTVGGVLPTASTMPNSMEYRNGGAECVYSLTSVDGAPTGYCLTLNCGEMPRNPIQTKLSDILEEWTDPKFRLSKQACVGILNRAERRGKALPPELKAALEEQANESCYA